MTRRRQARFSRRSFRAGSGAVAAGGVEGHDVGIAVRPEKVQVHRRAAPDGRIALRGRVREVAYYGDTSHVLMALDSGRTISANLQNAARSAAPAVAVGEKLWRSWNPGDTLALTD
jgi:ABC-type Fe3+/spermidine/putrescine transport system ATPase subunit